MERATKIVVELLAAGTAQSEVAEITGNTASAISQVATAYASQIVKRKSDMTMATSSHSQKLDNIESLAATKLESLLAVETDTNKVLNIFKALNGAARRDAGESPHNKAGNTTNNVVVPLVLPTHMQEQVKVVTNPNNDVVSVDGRDLSPASIGAVNKLANLDTTNGADEHERRSQAIDDIMEATLPSHSLPSADAHDRC